MKKDTEQKDKAVVDFGIAADLPELPDALPQASYQPGIFTYRDRNGKPLQGPGIPDGHTGLYFVSMASDVSPNERNAWIAKKALQGFGVVQGITVDGLASATVLCCRWEAYKALQSARHVAPKAFAPDGGSVTKFETTLR